MPSWTWQSKRCVTAPTAPLPQVWTSFGMSVSSSRQGNGRRASFLKRMQGDSSRAGAVPRPGDVAPGVTAGATTLCVVVVRAFADYISEPAAFRSDPLLPIGEAGSVRSQSATEPFAESGKNPVVRDMHSRRAVVDGESRRPATATERPMSARTP